MHIRDSETDNIVATRNVDYASHLYSFSHFGPSSPLSETHSLFSQESVQVKSGHLNLCVVPKTSVVTSTPPPPIQISSLARITLHHCLLL